MLPAKAWQDAGLGTPEEVCPEPCRPYCGLPAPVRWHQVGGEGGPFHVTREGTSPGGHPVQVWVWAGLALAELPTGSSPVVASKGHIHGCRASVCQWEGEAPPQASLLPSPLPDPTWTRRLGPTCSLPG